MPSKALGMRIAGTGRALPAKVLDNAYFTKRLDTSDEWIRERTGILERHVVVDGESTATLATAAGQAALADAGLKPGDVDLIIVSTITPECYFPSTACFVQQAIGARDIPAFDLSAACSGFIYGLIVGAHMLQSGCYRNILLIGAETMSRITDYEDRATCILFGDGAAAVVLTATPDASGPAMLHHQWFAQGSGPTILTVPAGGSRLPASQMTVNERLHYIKMQGREVYKHAVKRNIELVDSALRDSGVAAEEISFVFPHQSNLRIIESARQRLGLPQERMYTTIHRYGNTSAASIPLGFDECRKNGELKAGDLVLFIAFGAGFTWGSTLIRL